MVPTEYPRWVYYVLATNHYRKGDFDKALVEAKRANLTQFVWTPHCVAVAAGQLGRTADARAALDAISERYASYLEPARVRALWSMWQWDTDLVDRLLQGFSKALALVDRPGDA